MKNVSISSFTRGNISPEKFFPIQFVVVGEVVTFVKRIETHNISNITDKKGVNEHHLAIWNWMIGLGFPETWQQYTDFLQTDPIGGNTELSKDLSDGTLSILNNSFVPIQTIQFVGLFPISLNTLTLQATATDVNYLICSASFQYSHYKFVTN